MSVNNLSAIERFNLEKKAANQAARAIAAGLRSAVAQTTVDARIVKDKYLYRNSGFAAKSTGASAKYKDQRLSRIAMRAPHYIFKQHYGFEGTKKNGVNMRLRGTDVINIGLQKANALETLADALTDIRAEEVFTKLNFNTNGR